MRAFAPTALAALALAACQKEAAKPAKAPLPVQVTHTPPPATPAQIAVAPAAETPPPVTPVTPAEPAPAATPARVAAATPAALSAQSKPAAAASFGTSFDLVGTEPFWNLQIRPEALTLQRADHADLTAANPGYTELGSTALWTATVGKSRMVVTVTKAPCSDGMSERAYRYAAKVTLWGKTLAGCASRL